MTDISKLTDEEKKKYIETIPVGSLLYFPGHTMVYIGSNNGREYVISATGSLSDSDGELNVQSMYSVIINPLTTRRGVNAQTWLTNLTAVLTIVPPEYIKPKEEHKHNYQTTITKATLSKDGNITQKCNCGDTQFIKIAHPKTIKLKTTNYTYDGKAKKPAVIVTNSTGKRIEESNYDIKYSSNKKVGIAKAIITFKGNYEGKKELTFKINPRGTYVKNLTAGKKQFKATWNKQKTEITGYEIQYSTNKSFKSGNKKIKISKKKIKSRTVKGLKAKKKYYVRIRTYKKVKGKKYYSSWSKIKDVEIKF